MKKHYGIALTAAQQAMMFDAASGPWCMAAFLEVAVALGARRGEVLALRWSDLQDRRATIARSLTQTKQLLQGDQNGEAKRGESTGICAHHD